MKERIQVNLTNQGFNDFDLVRQSSLSNAKRKGTTFPVVSNLPHKAVLEERAPLGPELKKECESE